ncbi:PREDICTED: uncharacterized protein LOC104738555 [Camelina sativa]|uniref:Uncharacterized protein LOC104738555 n=1 Tax=Camelina sativa TaxID=90675 RepID=A0ABM0VJ44_CAMSA|nr:PREDICTED: uncharacterized protein LOC104738555 [Camelina sativa]XP_010457022.1 PREDICTED: uncharacterized protein LOC104738555 [Camelina sativa]
MNYNGSLTISAYGDTNQIPSSVQQALYSTGVTLNHVPAGVKDASDKKILVDMLLWAVDNPAPATFMLISGDRDYSYALHQLRMRRYNILLAQPDKASVPLISAAKTIWLWTNIAFGDCPRGKQGESSRPIDSGRQHHRSGTDVLSHPVRKQTQNIKQFDSALVSRTGNKRGGSFCELCNVVCSSHDLTFHISGKRHRSKLVQVAGERPHVTGLTEAKHVWCRVCQTSYNSEARYENHILGTRHQNKLEDQAGNSRKRVCRIR